MGGEKKYKTKNFQNLKKKTGEKVTSQFSFSGPVFCHVPMHRGKERGDGESIQYPLLKSITWNSGVDKQYRTSDTGKTKA